MVQKDVTVAIFAGYVFFSAMTITMFMYSKCYQLWTNKSFYCLHVYRIYIITAVIFSVPFIILKVFRKIKFKNTVVECPSSLYANVTFISEVKGVVSVVGLGVYNGRNQTMVQSVIRLKIVAVYVRDMTFTVSVWPVNL